MTTSHRPPSSAVSPFAGRGSELGALQHAIEAARLGECSAVLVIGEAGIGKTRLVNEAVDQVGGSGMRVLWASAWEPGGAPAYWHWIQTLRSLAAGHDRQALVRDLGADAEELSRLVPDLRAGVRLAEPGPPEGDDARFKMFDAVAGFLRRASDREPLVVVLEDLHAADAGTLALLRFFVENGAGCLAVIGTTRDPRRDPVNAEVVDALTELRRRMTTLPLAGLGPDDVAVMLEAIVGPGDAVRLTPEIHRRTSGNPLFVGELAHLLVAGRRIHDGLPDSIRAVIERRLAPLSDSSLALLRAAAVIGEEFGEGTRARAVLDEARSLYRSLGMEPRAELVTEVSASGTPPPPSRPVNVFTREGDYWTLGYRGRIVRVADAKGLRDIATLLARPGRELHVADLMAASDPSDHNDERARTAVLRGGASPDPMLDPRARAAYRERLLELRDELEEAEGNADLGRADIARAEMDAIAGELAAALGLGGLARPQPDASERARKAVSQRIRNSLKRLAEVHPELAAHLDRSIKTGRFCSYSPERQTSWSL